MPLAEGEYQAIMELSHYCMTEKKIAVVEGKNGGVAVNEPE